MTEQGRRCSKCGVWYPDHFVSAMFRTSNSRGRLNAFKRRWLCRGCEQDRRTETVRHDRWRSKARDVLRRHAKSISDNRHKLGLPPVTKEDLVDRYGWSIDRLAHDAEFQYGNGCNYCGDLYTNMGHGLGDITLDVQDPAKEPYYGTNTKWCCQTCNRKKGHMTPESFELDRQGFQWWMNQRERLASNPQEAGFLF